MRGERCKGTCDGDGPVYKTAEGLVCADCFPPGEEVPPPTDTYDSAGVVCPYCGHRHSDSDEYFGNNREDTELECAGCDQWFAATRMVSITYHGQPLRRTG